MDRILLFIPFYNCEKQIPRVVEQVKDYQEYFHEILLVDNRSQDESLQVAKDSLLRHGLKNVRLIKNLQNYNLGGSHKVAFTYASENNFSHLIVLHGDDQGDLKDLIPILKQKLYHQYECLLGARFHSDSQLLGYSKFRTVGNNIVNALCALPCRRKILDMGSGLNMYSRSFFTDQQILSFPNDLTFNVYLLFHSCFKNSPILFFPIHWRESDQISNAKVFKQFFKIFNLIFKCSLSKSSLYNPVSGPGYFYEVIYET